MKTQLVRDAEIAVANLRKLVQEKGKYRRLNIYETIDAEAYLAQILLALRQSPRNKLWDMILESLRGLR
jgi:hypothetical protein